VKREVFERGMQTLNSMICDMGAAVEREIYQAVESLRLRQNVLANAVIRSDKDVNERRWRLEEEALTFIAMQAPVAGDLRFVAAVMYIANELERIGDHAKALARITIELDGRSFLEQHNYIPQMSELGRKMLTEALAAFAKMDTVAARSIAERDDEIDEIYDRSVHELYELMRQDSGENIELARMELWALHNLERIGDRTVNICERTYFAATGKYLEIEQKPNG
jgi:phosphate transport system protein